MDIKQLATKIKEQNDLFNNATPEQKRCMVAQDCIDRIRLGQFNVAQGNYIRSSDYSLLSCSVSDVLNSQSRIECDVCAKGGLFMAHVGRVNEVTFKQIKGEPYWSAIVAPENKVTKKLTEIFEKPQLDLIEAAFEEEMVIRRDCVGEKLRTEAELYREKLYDKYKTGWENDKEVLLSICKNIIKNNGQFIPSDLVNPRARISFKLKDTE